MMSYSGLRCGVALAASLGAASAMPRVMPEGSGTSAVTAQHDLATFPFTFLDELGMHPAGARLASEDFIKQCFNFVLASVGTPEELAGFETEQFVEKVVSACVVSDGDHCQEWATGLGASVRRKLHVLGTPQFDADPAIGAGGALSYGAWCERVFETQRIVKDIANKPTSPPATQSLIANKAVVNAVSFPFNFVDEVGAHEAGARLPKADFDKLCFNFILSTWMAADQVNLDAHKFTTNVVSSCRLSSADKCTEWAQDLWGCVTGKVHAFDSDNAIGQGGSWSYGGWCNRVYEAQVAALEPTRKTNDLDKATGDDTVVVLLQEKRSLRRGRLLRGK